MPGIAAATDTSSSQRRIDQQNRFLDNIRDPYLKKIKQYLRDAVQALTAAQRTVYSTYR